jgi:hypothetical protein
MRTSTITQSGCIHSIERLSSSPMGNPRFALKVSLWNDDYTFERTTIETSPNSMIAYSIDQSMLCSGGGGSFEFTYHVTAVLGTKVLDGFESLNERREREHEETQQRMAVIDRQMTECRDRLAKRQAARTASTAEIDFPATLQVLKDDVADIRAALRGDQS